MKQTIRLTESQIRSMIEESVKKMIAEGEVDEAFWNQLKQGAKSAFGKGVGSEKSMAMRQNGGFNVGKRWNAAKQGFKSQGQVDEIDRVAGYLQKLVDAGKVSPDQTVGQLLSMPGGSNKFQKGSLGQMRSQANAAASKAQNDIYR